MACARPARTLGCKQTLASIVGDVDVLLPSNGVVTAEVIARRPGSTLDPANGGRHRVDRFAAAAAARGIPICNAPGTSTSRSPNVRCSCARPRRRAVTPVARSPRATSAYPSASSCRARHSGIIGWVGPDPHSPERAHCLGMTVIDLGRGATRAERIGFFAAATRSASTARCHRRRAGSSMRGVHRARPGGTRRQTARAAV